MVEPFAVAFEPGSFGDVKYQSAVTAPIAELDLQLRSGLAAAAEDAAVVIAQHDRELTGLTQWVEVLASSRLEHVEAETLAVSRALSDRRLDATPAGLVAANLRAHRIAAGVTAPITEGDVAAWHHLLMASQPQHTPGEYRRVQNWLGGPRGIGSAVFIPPRQERVAQAMADLVRFVGRTDIPAVVHAAIAHAQLEAIHPFTDGNGRTGRCLIHAMLTLAGVSRSATIPISLGLLHRRREYQAALAAYRGGQLQPLVGLFVAAIADGVNAGVELRRAAREFTDRLAQTVRARPHAKCRVAMEMFVDQPELTATQLADGLKIRQANVWRTMAPLVATGMVTEGRGVWSAPVLLDQIDSAVA